MGETLISKIRHRLQDTNLIFWWYEKLFKLCGYWPSEETGFLLFVHNLFVYVTIMAMIIAPVMMFSPKLNNLIELGIAGNGVAISSITLAYTLVMYLHKDEIKSSLVNLAKFRPSEESMSESEMAIRKNIQRKNVQTFVGMYITVVEILMSLLAMGLEILKTRKYPMKLWVPYDASITPYFELSFLFAAPFFVFNALLMPWAMFYQFFCCKFMVGECEVLGSKIENIRAKAVENVVSNLETVDGDKPQIQADKLEGEGKKFSGVLQLSDRGNPQGKSPETLQSVQNEEVLTALTGLAKDNTVQKPGVQMSHLKERGLDGTEPLKRVSENPEPNLGELTCEADVVSHSLISVPRETNSNTGVNRDILLDNEMIRLLVQYIQEHQTILEYLSQHDSFFGAMLLADTLFSLVTCCLTAFITKKLPAEERDVPYMLVVMIVIGMLHMLWVKCALVDQLSCVTSDIRDAAYACEWQDSSEEFKQCLRILISRANVPYVMSGLGFVEFSVKTFDAVINTVYSYYTVISNLDKSAQK